ncbi:unnamed protein product [Staurois parvus]|uniref:Uncharacterized protein n=1 Tax=Staurois parvus TaxID=386267 RepID=A0ABN9EDR7_9NEOB|nr:unnamed protein product [Staurois parvus]
MGFKFVQVCGVQEGFLSMEGRGNGTSREGEIEDVSEGGSIGWKKRMTIVVV